jgi:hypothetical protein
LLLRRLARHEIGPAAELEDGGKLEGDEIE